MMKSREQMFLESSSAAGQSAPVSACNASDAVVASVESDALFHEARTVLCYMAIPGEVELHPAFARWQEIGKRIALPLVVGDELVLKEYDPANLRPGYRGISEPGDDAPVIAPDEIDLALVPGVAFTPDGFRLGRGKGFYDRLLPKLRCPKYGVCFPFRIVPQLPVDPWDVKLDKVMTHE